MTELTGGPDKGKGKDRQHKPDDPEVSSWQVLDDGADMDMDLDDWNDMMKEEIETEKGHSPKQPAHFSDSGNLGSAGASGCRSNPRSNTAAFMEPDETENVQAQQDGTGDAQAQQDDGATAAEQTTNQTEPQTGWQFCPHASER